MGSEWSCWSGQGGSDRAPACITVESAFREHCSVLKLAGIWRLCALTHLKLYLRKACTSAIKLSSSANLYPAAQQLVRQSSYNLDLAKRAATRPLHAYFADTMCAKQDAQLLACLPGLLRWALPGFQGTGEGSAAAAVESSTRACSTFGRYAADSALSRRSSPGHWRGPPPKAAQAIFLTSSDTESGLPGIQRSGMKASGSCTSMHVSSFPTAPLLACLSVDFRGAHAACQGVGA